MPKLFKRCEKKGVCEDFMLSDCLALECFKLPPQAANPPMPQVCSKDLLSADDLEYLERLSDRLTASGFSWQHTDYSRLLCIVPDLVIKLKTSGI
jgi:hypothetical protein